MISWIERFVWYMLILAPWFFMMARLKNMGYGRKDLKRFFEDFGKIVGTMTAVSLVVGAIADVLFNWLIGSFLFGRPIFEKRIFNKDWRIVIPEFPREAFFTDRVKRWAKAYDQVEDDNNEAPLVTRMPNHQEEMGNVWRNRLNKIYPDHV